MDYHQQDNDDSHSTLTISQPINALSSTSTEDLTSKTISLVVSNININRSSTRTRPLRKRYNQQQKQIEHYIASPSTTITTSISSSTGTIIEKNERQEARPLGTCVRKCSQCRQLKHILLAECTVCFRMLDVDLKDCKCQMITNRNIIGHFICSICNSELTLDGYIICANRASQTTLAIKENNIVVPEKSVLTAMITNICYPKSGHRTVAVQVNTLINLSPLQRFLSASIDNENEKSSSLSWSKRDLNTARIVASDSSDAFHMSGDSDVGAPLNNIARNMTRAFNSNQPTKLALQAEVELRQKQSQAPDRTSINETMVKTNLETMEIPKSPRCLAIMNVRKRHDRLSTLLTLQTNKTCQTQLSCLTNIIEMIQCERILNAPAIRTNNPSRIERQIQVDTLKGRSDDLCQVRLETADHIDKDSAIGVIKEERILQALTDRDGQRWPEFIDQLINEQSHLSLSELAQQLLDTIECLHTAERLNSLTTGQLQRKIRYAMSRFKSVDEHLHLRNDHKTRRNHRSSEASSRKTAECNGRVDMAVTVRQIDKHHNRQSVVPSDQNWRPYVDRLFNQGYSAEEIQRLLHEAAKTTMQSDDQRLQDVFDYINTKTKSPRAKTAPAGLEFISTLTKSKLSTDQKFPPTNVLQAMKTDKSSGTIVRPLSERKHIFDGSPPVSTVQDLGSVIKAIKKKSSTPRSSEKTSVVDLNTDEQERNSPLYSSADQEQMSMMATPRADTVHKHQSITSTGITFQQENIYEKRSDSENIVDGSVQKIGQKKDLDKSETSPIRKTIDFHPLKASSTIVTTLPNTSDNMLLTSLEEKCIDALHHVQDNLDNQSHPHSSNIQSEINNLINAFQSNLSEPNNISRDNLESSMMQCVELLNNEQIAIISQLDRTDFRKLNDEISKTLTLLEQYKQVMIPVIANNEESTFNRHISSEVTISSDAQVPLQRTDKILKQTIASQSQANQSLPNTIVDLNQQNVTREYQESASLIRCRPIPYTSSNEKTSTENLKQVLIDSTEHISLKNQGLDRELIAKNNELSYVPETLPTTDDNLHGDQSQTKWLDSLLSKISDNVTSTTDILATSPSLSAIHRTKIDHNNEQKEESIILKTVDKQVSSPISIDRYAAHVSETTDHKPKSLYHTDTVMLEKEHAMSILTPEHNFSILYEQFQVSQMKITERKSTTSSAETLNYTDQLLPFHNEKHDDDIHNTSVNFEHDSNESKKSSPTTSLHTDSSNEEKQSTSFVVQDEPQSLATQSTFSSDIELTDEHEVHQNTVSLKQLLADDASISEDNFAPQQNLLDSENNKKTSSALATEDIEISKTDPNISIESSSPNNQGEEETKPPVSSVSADENENQNLRQTSEVHKNLEQTPHPSYNDRQVLDEHAYQAVSEVFKHYHGIHHLQLPISAQYLTSDNMIQSNSSLTHLNDQDNIASLKESISSNNSTSDAEQQSLIDSEDRNIIAASVQHGEDKKTLDEKINNALTDQSHTPTILSLNHSITHQSTNTVLSPSRITKIENNRYKKFITPSPSPLEPPSSPTDQISKENEFNTKRKSVPQFLIEEPSVGSVTTSIEATILDEDDGKERSHTSMSNSLTLANTPSSGTDLFNDTAHTSPLLLKSNKKLITDQTDNEQSKTQPPISGRFSRPRIIIDDVQSPLVSTPPSSMSSTASVDHTRVKLEQQSERETQFISEETESSNTSSSTMLEQKNISSNIPVQSTREVKSSPNENTVATKNPNRRYNKSEENANVHSLAQVAPSDHDEEHQSKKIKCLKSDSLIEQRSKKEDSELLFSTKQSIIDDAEHNDRANDQFDNQKAKRVDSSSPIKRPPIMSTTTAVLPSSTVSVRKHEQNSTLRDFSSESKGDKSISDGILPVSLGEIQGPISVSSFNLTHLDNLIPDGLQQIEDGNMMPQKRQPSRTDSFIRSGIPSPPIPKLLFKRSSVKQASTIVQGTNPNGTLSITDISTSSNNTIPTDHLLHTHSTINDREEVILPKKINRGNRSKDAFMDEPNAIPKRKTLRKTSRPLQNQSFTTSNSRENHVKISKKKITDKSLGTSSDLVYDTELGSDAWMQSREDISQILIIDEEEENKPQTHQRHKKKPNKTRLIDQSRLMPFNLKARGDHQAYTIDSSKLPSIEQSCGEHQMKKFSNDPYRRPMIRLPVTQIEKFECGTIGPRRHPSSITRQLFDLPSLHARHPLSSQIHQTTESLTDRFYRLMSSEKNDDKQAFESILNWQQQYRTSKVEPNKFQYMYLLDTSVDKTVRGRQYPILTDEIDLIDDPNACTIVNKWAFADLVNAEREKYLQQSTESIKKSIKRSNPNKNIKICLQKRPLTQFEQHVFKEVDIISMADSQTVLLHIPSITVDNQVFIKNRKFKCDQTFDEHCHANSIYHSTLSPLLDRALDGSKCLCLIGGGKHSGKTSLLRSLIDLVAFDFIHLISTHDIYIKSLGICHNRIVDLLQNYSPVRLMKTLDWTLIPNEQFHLKTDQDIDYIVCQIKKRRRFMHQLIQINFHQKDQSMITGSLMIIVLASSQYVYTRNLCSHRRKFLINSLNKTMLSFKRALLGIRGNPDRVRAVFNNDILTRLMHPYVFDERSSICYIGTLNPGHRHRIATKSTLEFARNLRFCLKRLTRQRRRQEKLSQMTNNNDDDDDAF